MTPPPQTTPTSRPALPPLSNQQHAFLLRLLCDDTAALPTQKRAAILLLPHACLGERGSRLSVQEIAGKASCSPRLVTHTWLQFARQGLEAALSSSDSPGSQTETVVPIAPATPIAPVTPATFTSRGAFDAVDSVGAGLQEARELVSRSEALIRESHELLQMIRSTSRTFQQMTADSQAALRQSWTGHLTGAGAQRSKPLIGVGSL